MNESPAVLAPYRQGPPTDLVEPGYVIRPQSVAAHDFFNVVRDLTHHATYHDESQRDAAVRAIDAYEKHTVGSDHAHVFSEDDRAPKEDVSLRKPPGFGGPVVYQPAAVSLDYDKLAKAIIAAQASAQNQSNTPEE